MSTTALLSDSGRGRADQINLETVLDAWREATDRLQRTHETLRTEVRRLTRELEIKNRELARKNRLADLGQMATHVAHEVRNSLVPITLYLSLLRRRLQNDAAGLDALTKMEAGFTALEATVSDLLQFTAQRDPVGRSFRVLDLIAEVCQSLAPQMEAQGIEVQLDLAASDMLCADRGMLRRALLNLILNALDAMPDGGELTITGWSDACAYELEVADSGPGFPRESRHRMFEPFYTTKNNGTGLGLAIVGRIAEVHGGEVHAGNCAQGGAAFTLRIPSHLQEAAA
jgi:signal transduction histidine kinase